MTKQAENMRSQNPEVLTPSSSKNICNLNSHLLSSLLFMCMSDTVVWNKPKKGMFEGPDTGVEIGIKKKEKEQGAFLLQGLGLSPREGEDSN